MGNRDDIDEMPAGNADVLLTVLKLVDRYDLYGLVAYPKHHKQSDVSHIYALAAKSKVSFRAAATLLALHGGCLRCTEVACAARRLLATMCSFHVRNTNQVLLAGHVTPCPITTPPLPETW